MERCAILAIVLLVFAASFSSVLAQNLTCEARLKICDREVAAGRSCPLFLVPPRSLPPKMNPEGFLLRKIAPGVYSYLEADYMNVIAVKGRRLAVFDFPAGHTKFIKAVRMVLNGVAPYRINMVYGHRHTDHIGGATGFRNWARRTYPRAHIDIWGTRGTFNFLEQRRPKEPRPNKFVPAAWGRAIYLGPGFTIRLRIIGGHVHDDMMAIFPMPRAKVFIHLADFVAPRFAQIDSFGFARIHPGAP